MGTWTNQGFVAKTKSYYQAAIQQVFVDAFGSDFDLNPNLPQNILIERLAELFYGMDMDGVEAFARLNLNTMEGLFLDVVGVWRGINRVLGKPQQGLVAVTCNPDNFTSFTVPEGTVLTVTETGEQFVTTRIATFTSNTGTLEIEYTSDGNSTAIIGNTMTVSLFPQINNLEIVSLIDGTEDESDISYRSRLKNEYPAAVGTLEYVSNLLRALPTVKAVGCLYNDTAETAGLIGPYCTEWMVAPTVDVTPEAEALFKQTVGEVIIDNKVPGAPTDGNTTVTVTDALGSVKTVKFTVAEEVPIEIELTVSTPESTGVLDLSGTSEIKAKVVEYVNSLEIGKDVSYSRCMAPFAADTGFDILSFRMKAKSSDTWITNGNLSITSRQYASLAIADITVGI